METIKKIVQVECEFDSSHIIKKMLEIKAGTEEVQSTIQVYCPFCQKYINGKIQGEVHLDDEAMRKFGFND
ncbi:hypothetical protein GMMP13_750002 [Candidatus Magnetomoraceae bacterium gMMP-13]